MRRFFVLLLALMLGACANMKLPEKPQVSLLAVNLESVNLFEQRFVLTLKVSNPNDIALPIDGVSFNVALNQVQIGQAAHKDKFTLPANGESTVKIRVSTQLATLLQQAHQLQSAKTLNYQIDGEIFTPFWPGGIPFVRQGEVPALKASGLLR